MMKSFTSELGKYIKEGAPNVTPEAYAARLDVCNGCDKLNSQSMRCMSCGCLLEHKAKWKTADCPEKKWAPEVKPELKLGTDPKIAKGDGKK